MKQVLVMLPFDETYRRKLSAIAGDACNLQFWDSQWERGNYQKALEEANVILGEPELPGLSLCRNLEWMQITWSGVDGFVQTPYFPRNAVLSSATGLYGPIISEHMLALTLALCRRLPEYARLQAQKTWELLLYDKPLEGSHVLILGAGDIGTTLARWLRPMVGQITGVRRVVRPYPECFDNVITLAELDSVLPQADIVLCCLPKTGQTDHILNEARLRSMKPDAVLVNAGRGNLIDLQALCRVLDEDRLWGVGLDVTETEPLPPEHPIWSRPRVIITPHAAGNSFGPGSPTERKIWDFVLQNFERYMQGLPVASQVDFSAGYCARQK